MLGSPVHPLGCAFLRCGCVDLTEIYNYLQTKFACFVNDSTASWKNSVRHNLSIHPQFQRISVQ